MIPNRITADSVRQTLNGPRFAELASDARNLIVEHAAVIDTLVNANDSHELKTWKLCDLAGSLSLLPGQNAQDVATLEKNLALVRAVVAEHGGGKSLEANFAQALRLLTQTAKPHPIRREDYAPPPHVLDGISMDFRIFDDHTELTTEMNLVRNPNGDPDAPVVLVGGKQAELVALYVREGSAMPATWRQLQPHEYSMWDGKLELPDLPEPCTLRVVTRLCPDKNKVNEGLYQTTDEGSGRKTLLTQCEAEGFREMTWGLDRSDVMTTYKVRIEADQEQFPVLRSNGNQVGAGALPGGRHWVEFKDPFPKPSYLFAMVAGQFDVVEDAYHTKDGRDVALRLYVDPGDAPKAQWAMRCLKEAMRWDEEENGLVCDLDEYAVVATGTFNAGAMENKGLNIFNSVYVLADPRSATDEDFAGIERVIGHEYFHNWTGDRITCRDWFQLTLKEALTVFRDQMFSTAMGQGVLNRIDNVVDLRLRQFPEDASPMAHAIRPDEVVSISNFYTATVYSKGAEVARMQKTLHGEAGFRAGMDLYVKRHDGCAVTCDDFVAAMADANGFDATQFLRWYSQVGTPSVEVTSTYDRASERLTLTFSQSQPPKQGAKQPPLLIPVAIGLVGQEGDVAFRMPGETEASAATRLYQLTQEQQTLVLEGVPQDAVPSLLRGFSAPVKLVTHESDADLLLRVAHDSDPFNRWDAAQQLGTRLLQDAVAQSGKKGAAAALEARIEALVAALANVLRDTTVPPALVARLLELLRESELLSAQDNADPEKIHSARERIRQRLAEGLAPLLAERYQQAADATKTYVFNQEAMGLRSLKNSCLGYLVAVKDNARYVELAQQQFARTDNMTDKMGALSALVEGAPDAVRQDALDRFYAEWHDDPLVLDKWFALQASCGRDDTLERVQGLMQHEKFVGNKLNPNRVRSLVRTFARNPRAFHAADGRGYALLADEVIRIDSENPKLASGIIDTLLRWKGMEPRRQKLMRAALQRILDERGAAISKDVYEKVSKALAG